jgi:hypothetical protein
VVLDADPTKDIRNTDKIHRVMLGGRLYDPVTLNEVVTGKRVRPPYWWEAHTGAGGTPVQGPSGDVDDDVGDTGGD